MVASAEIGTFTFLPLEGGQGYLLLKPWLLRWRRRHLWIKIAEDTSPLSSLWERKKLALVRCLDLSSIQSIRLDPLMTEADLRLWADEALKLGRQIFLHIPGHPHLPDQHSPWQWRIKRVADWIGAACLVLLLAPLLLAIAGLMTLTSPGPIFFRQWRVGRRGRLFRIFKFRTMVPDAETLHHQVMGQQQGLHKLERDPRVTALGRHLRKYSLDELPQLFNVLRGEMSLVGPRPWALYDAVRLPKAGLCRLNALPGITGAWQVKARSTELNLETVTTMDLSYLEHWSLLQDCLFLLQTIPKVLSGFGSH